MDWNGLFESASRHGLGIVLAIIITFLFTMVLRNLIKSHSNERKLFIEMIKDNKLTVENHLDHLTQSIINTDKTLIKQGESFENGIQKICDQVGHQTDLIREMYLGKK